jgi:S1-C subfamily serine protease
VALLAGLLGAVVGTAVVLAATGGTATEQSQQAAGARPAPPPRAPTVEASGAESLGQVSAVAKAVLPTVVKVNVAGSGLFGGSSGNGSGVIYRSDANGAYIITNNHVAAQSDDLQVTFADGDTADADIVGTDRLSDLAVLRVNQSGLTAIQVGNSSSLQVGEVAVALGSPFGLQGTVTAGIVSALNRPLELNPPESEPFTLPNVIQTDAPINPGNSGGPLVNGEGKLIGINSAIATSGQTPSNAGVGFAIPVNTAVDVADKLIAEGSVEHPFLGIRGQDVSSELARRFGVEDGALIREVVPDSPAGSAGLQSDDVIVSFGGTDITAMDDLVGAVRQRNVGETVSVTFVRDGTERTTQATLADRDG